jgi:hypothetical protein
VVSAPTKGVLQNFTGSPGPTLLNEWLPTVPDPQRGPTSAQTFFQQTKTGVTALGCLVWPGLAARCLNSSSFPWWILSLAIQSSSLMALLSKRFLPAFTRLWYLYFGRANAPTEVVCDRSWIRSSPRAFIPMQTIFQTLPSMTLSGGIVNLVREGRPAEGTRSGRPQQPRPDRGQDPLPAQPRTFFLTPGKCSG